MDRNTEVRTLLIILATLIGLGILFWGISAFMSSVSESGEKADQVEEFEAPDEGFDSDSETEGESETESETEGETEGEEGEDQTASTEESGEDPSTGGGENTSGDGEETNLSEAEKTFQKALLSGEESGKNVFLRFGAPWCPGCWQLTEFLARLEVQEVYSKYFIDTELDVDVVEGARVLLNDLAGENPKLPWYAIFDSSGQLIATSDTYEESIGFMPSTPEDRDHFISMFEKAEVVSPEELTLLRSSLEIFIAQNTR